MINLRQAVIVEGKYDKIKLSSVINGVIICTGGFNIYKDKEKMSLIRHYAEKTGIIILTDSDSAGFKIRNYLKGAVKNGQIINVYIPDIFGKERRKAAPSKEGKLGVEGMSEEIILDAFRRAGVAFSEGEAKRGDIDKMLLYELGFSGTPDASERRRRLLKKLGLPELLTTGAMAEILNTMMTADELIKITLEMNGGEGER
ncbi:MAG: DUF4093 domain-containing protein [Oscillospiraceae bacterium]|nr:DUF4093 domain-containing protein [Oscillospiraceae bacterium]